MNDLFALCGLSRQAHHQALKRMWSEEEKSFLYVGLMEQVRQIHPGMGIRTMYELLQPEGIGRDSFIALGLREGYRLKTIEKYTRTTYSVKSNRYKNLLDGVEFWDINQLWSSDITYYYGFEKFYYIVLIMGNYSRRIVGYNLADNMRAENNLAALKMALTMRGIDNYDQTLIHHSDKGTQYTSDTYTEALDTAGIRISMCREVYENTHIERLNDTIKNQYLYRMQIDNIKQLGTRLDEVIKSYNGTRPHQSINRLSPIQYEDSLLKIPKEKRTKMIIYTVKTSQNEEQKNQLELFKLK
jgi:putative transposase